MKIVYGIILILLVNSVFAQTSFEKMWGGEYINNFGDTSKARFVYCYSEQNLTIYKNGKFHFKHFRSFEHGLVINKKERQGWWNVYDEKNNLVKQEFYIEGIPVKQINYNKRTTVLVFQKKVECPEDKYELTHMCLKITERVIFNKRGKIIKHIYYLPDKSVRIEFPSKKPKIKRL